MADKTTRLENFHPEIAAIFGTADQLDRRRAVSYACHLAAETTGLIGESSVQQALEAILNFEPLSATVMREAMLHLAERFDEQALRRSRQRDKRLRARDAEGAAQVYQRVLDVANKSLAASALARALSAESVDLKKSLCDAISVFGTREARDQVILILRGGGLAGADDD